MSSALLLLRLVFGLAMAAHGSQKLFGWFGGYGIAGTGGFFESLGFRPGKAFALAAGLSEFGGGLLIAPGFLGPVGPALVLATMLVAILAVHRQNGFFVTSNGIEVPLLYATTAISLALSRFGSMSLDAVLGLRWTGWIIAVVLFAGVAGALGNLAVRRAPVAKTA